MSDDKGGSVHAVLSDACLSTPPVGGVSNAVSGLAAVMVPARFAGADIGGAHVCVWRPVPGGPPRMSLVGDFRHDSAAARALAKYLNALPLAPSGPTSCPSDDGAAALVVFGYSHDRAIDVFVALSGCRYANNGWRGAAAGDPLEQALFHPLGAAVPTTLPPSLQPTTSLIFQP